MAQSNLNQAGVEAARLAICEGLSVNPVIYSYEYLAKAAIAAYLECVETWKDIEELPQKKGQTVYFNAQIPMRWCAYKPQALKQSSRLGRFQVYNGWGGWVNTDIEPTHYLPTTGDSR